jgi:hypothetical protein
LWWRVEKFYERQEKGVSSDPALNEATRRVLMKTFTGLGAQMSLINQPLNQGRNLAIAFNLRSQISEHGRLDV